MTKNDELVLVSQYRIPVDSEVLELPADLVGDDDSNESIEVAARRELYEETGYSLGSFEEVLTYPISPGLTNEMITFVLDRTC